MEASPERERDGDVSSPMLDLLPVLWPRVYLIVAACRRQLTEGSHRGVKREGDVHGVCQAINL